MFIEISWALLIIGYAGFIFLYNPKSFTMIIISSLILLFSFWFTFNFSKTFWVAGDYEFDMGNNRIIKGCEVKQDFFGEYWYIKDATLKGVLHKVSVKETGVITIK